jgi:outer membrane protein assembly factor BamB
MAMTKFPRMVLLLGAVLGGTALASAADWPQFLGPNRNGSSPETGLLTQWSAEGPKVLWKAEGGIGYSGISVVGGRAYTQVQRGNEELVLALDAVKGTEIWKQKIGPGYKNTYGDGPRSTPTVEDGRLYVQSVNGPLLCMEADSGKIVWQHDLFKEFEAKNIDWGTSASPLVEGDLVLVVPGGKAGGVAAFQKKDGKLAWKTADDKAGYASPIVMNVDGKKQSIFFTAVGLLAVQPGDGKELWRLGWKTAHDVNIATPLIVGNQLFVSSGEGVGCAMLQPSASGEPKAVWQDKGPKSAMKNYWATAVLHAGHLYGISGEYEGVANLNCVDAKTGKLAWSKERFGRANLTLADGHLYLITIDGQLVVVPASPKEYQEKGRSKLLPAMDRYVNSPTISDKKMYLRDQKNIVCVDIAGK